MKKKLNALVIGAGAIGRGYIPWELKNFDISFYDSNSELVSSMEKQGYYTTFMLYGDRLEERKVYFNFITSDINKVLEEKYDIVFCCVGPRNISKLPSEIGSIDCPIYSLENDPEAVIELRDLLNKENIYFGVPDVITSCTASPENLKKDPLSVHTENGVLYLEDHGDILKEIKDLTPNILWVGLEKMATEWDAKLYLHNTPHCIAAFFGYFHNCNYLHEALAISEVSNLIEGVLGEILQTLKILTEYEHVFMEEYAEKEMRRFSNRLLYDPVTRVAREPLRKLHPKGRLVGALKMAIQAGINPINLATGVCAALKYNHPLDPDATKISFVDKVGVENFLDYFLGIQPDSAESKLISETYRNFNWRKEGRS